MATKKKAPSKAYAFIQTALKRNPKAAYADIAKGAKAKRIKLAPVLYGKVKLDLGLVKRKKKNDMCVVAIDPKGDLRRYLCAALAKTRPEPVS